MRNWIDKIKSINNEQGIALVVVLMVIVVISILGVSLMGLAATNVKMSTGERNNQSAYYIAESGITYKMNDIKTRIIDSYQQAGTASDFFTKVRNDVLNLNLVTLKNTSMYNDFDVTYGTKPTATITIEELGTNISSFTRDYKVTSVGKINDRSRTVVATFHVSWKPKGTVSIPTDSVLFVNKALTIQNVPTNIVGTLGLGGSATIKQVGSKPFNYGNIYNGTTIPDITAFPDFSISNTTTFSGTYLKMDSDKSFGTINVASGNTLSIDIGNKYRSIFVNNLNVNGNITITGTGKLTIYVKNINLGSNSILNTGKNIDKLYLFLEGAGTSLSYGKIYGSIFAKSANITVDGSYGVQGHIITGEANTILLKGTIDTTFPRLIYAPKSDVQVNSSFNGTIISNSVTSSGNNDTIIIQRVQIDYENSPFFLDFGSGNIPIKDMYTTEPIREN